MADEDEPQLAAVQRLIRASVLGQLPIGFSTFEDVERWVDEEGGELELRNAIARSRFSPTGQAVAEAWLLQQERKRTNQRESEALEIARRAAVASEKSARYAMWSATISAAVGVVTAATFVYQFFR